MIIYVKNKYKPLRKSKKNKVAVKKTIKAKVIPTSNFFNPVVATAFRRETRYYPSRNSTGGSTTKPISGNVYTGDNMLGIGQLHKSNSVPVFRKQDAEDQAKMRRG